MERALRILAALLLLSCRREQQTQQGPLVVWAAASLTLARRMTELGQTPDVLLLADRGVFPALLMPAHVDRYALFARNRIVLAYGRRARGADELARSARWWDVLERP